MNKPLKRPSQARARFTVQAIYDAFVRIWQRDGWDRLTTRSVALETGISVGTRARAWAAEMERWCLAVVDGSPLPHAME